MIKEKISKGFMQFIPVIIFYSITVFLSGYDVALFDLLKIVMDYLLMPLLMGLLLRVLYGNYYALLGFGIGALITFLELSFFGVFIALVIVIVLKEKVRLLKQDGKFSKGINGLIISIITAGVLYLLSFPLIMALESLETFINSLSNANIVIFVGVLAVFSSIDLGGPLNKVAYTFTLTFYLEGAYHLVGPLLVAVSIPPFTMFFTSLLMPNLFSNHLLKNRKRTLAYASLGITEGAIPYVIEKPKILMPSVILGSVVASMLAASFNLENTLLLTSVLGLIGTNKIGYYLLAHGIGIISGIVMIKLLMIKRTKVESIR